MHDAVPMRMVERLGDLDRVAQGLIRGQAAAGQAAGDAFRPRELHHQVGAAVLLADV